MLPLEEAQKYLEIVRKRGEAKVPLNRVYANIRKHKGLFLMAYANLYANKGALTPGVDPHDTVDRMSMQRIDAIIDTLERKVHQWTPVRRTYIEKKQNSRKLRPLGMPGWTDKLLEEVIRMVLEAYYEPQFRNSSHGFRPNRGCHTALDTIKKWKGTRWFIEGDIKGCFDNLQFDVIVGLLKRSIKDKDFLKFIWDMLNTGYMENWVYHKTYSGTPQGGIASPLLANIVLNELDKFIEDELIPKYTRGKRRKANPEYEKWRNKARWAKKKDDWKRANEIWRIYTKIPYGKSNDPNFRRLWYIRYADDFLLGFIGTRAEAEVIKEEIGSFLKSLKVDMSEEKTVITHAFTQKARFLNYEINLMNANDKIGKVGQHRQRTTNSELWFSVPKDVIEQWKAKVTKKGSITHRAELQNISDYDIISTYEVELQGLINYYTRAHNVYKAMSYLRYLWEQSLTKTLAAKHQTKVTTIYRRYQMFTADGQEVIGVAIPRKGKKPLRAAFGKKPIQRKTNTKIQDNIHHLYIGRNELLTRLLANVCELCGSSKNVEAHHIRKLADLKKTYQGRKEKPGWVKKMIAIRRKTLFVCEECHNEIHNGTYDGVALAKA